MTIFSFIILLFLWMFQILLLDTYYEHRKASDMKRLANEISKTYNVGTSDTPDVTIEGDSLVLQVRLAQNTSQGIVYTELMEPVEYKKGTILPIIFKDIEGEANVETGSVQVVDVVNDKILYTAPIQFHP